MTNPNLITFLDAAQRTIIGELGECTENTFAVINPVVVNIAPRMVQKQGPDGSTQNVQEGILLQLIPLSFREFNAIQNTPVTFTYNKDNVTQISFDGGFDVRLYAQYNNVVNPPEPETTAAAPENKTPPTVKLFDEEKK